MRRLHKFRTETEMRSIIREVETGQVSKSEAQRKYNIHGNGTINYWIAKFRELSKPQILEYNKLTKEELINKLKKLERQLEDEQIRSDGYSKMIDIAEEQLNINIRKKSDAKRSRK